MAVRNFVELVELIENTLGWVHPQNQTWYKARALASRRLHDEADKNPVKFTLANLELAVEYMRRRRLSLAHPVGILYYVDDALKYGNEAVMQLPLTQRVEAAIGREYEFQAPDWEDWVSRLRRGFGDAREDVLRDWLAAGRGE